MPSGASQTEDLAALPDDPSSRPHPSSPSVSHRVQQVEAEQVKLLYTQAPIGFVATVLNAAVVVFVLWGSVASSLLIAWFVLIVTITLSRLALVLRYRRAISTADQVRSWRTLFILGAGAAGVAWGASGLLLFPPELMAHQVFLALVLGGMAVGAVGLLSSVMAAFLAFFIPTVLPIIVRFLVPGGTVPVAMGLLGLSFAGALLAIARNFHASILESLNLRFENYELIRSLTVAKGQAEAAMHVAHQSEQRYRGVIEEQTDLICRFRPDTTLTFVNSAYCRYFGRRGEELLGKSFLSLIPETEQQAAAAHIASLLEHPRIVLHEHTAVNGEGELRWQQWADQAIVDDTGRVVEFQSVGRDITERKQAEEAVRRSEEYFRALTENALDIITIVNSDGTVRYVSPSVERVLGYTRQDVIGTDGFGFVHPDDLSELMTTFAEALQKPGVALYRSEYRLRHQDGSWRIFESVRKNLLDNPAIEGIVVNARDITVRKQAEEALRQAYQELERRVEERTAELATTNAQLRQEITERQRAEEELIRLSTAVRMSTDSLVICDLAGTISDVNEATLKMYGTAEKEDLVGKSAFELIVPEDQAKAIAGMEETLDKGFIQNREYQIGIKDGRTIPVEMSVALMKDSGGNVMGFVGTSRDITERKQAEVALRESEELYRTLVETSPDAITLTDLDSTILMVNRRALALHGYERAEEMLGRSAFDFVAPEDQQRATANAQQTLTTGGVSNIEYTLLKQDGTRFLAELSAGTIRDAEGKPKAFIGMVRDITERKQAADELLKAKEAAEAANRVKSEFLSTMSHELRTPTSIILGYGSLLLEGMLGSLSEEQAHFLRRINNSAKELRDLITAVLDVSRLEAGRLPLEMRVVEVHVLLEEIKAETEAERERVDLTYTWTTQGELPPLHTDPGKLKIVLKNLIRNAVKFTEEGSITVEALNCRGGIEFRVVDTGVGIPVEALELIFEPFRQVGTAASDRMKGTGLGLHIVKRLLALLGGTITVESKLGSGSTFRAWVPREHSTSLYVSSDTVP
jgi:PAS domain S-box-containing protein